MANKNKNITSLVGAADNDPTSDFEVIPTLIPEYDGVRRNLDVDQNISGIDNDDSDDTNWSEAELRKLLNVRKLKIDDLKFELQQINGRRQGLEDELTVREQIASSINSEIRGARRQLMDAAGELQSLQAEYESVRLNLESANEQSLRKCEEADQATKESASKSTRIAELENEIRNTRSELADLRQYIDGRKERWLHHESDIELLNDQVSNSRVDLEALSSKLGQRDDQLADIRTKFARESEELAKQKIRAGKLSDENSELKNVTTADALKELKAYQDQVARQTGELAARARSIEALRKDNGRIETYSNSLRVQLQDQVSSAKLATSMRHKLEASIEVTNDMISSLTSQLDDEKVRNQELAKTTEKLEKQFDKEVRLIRFELSSAQETLADQETISEQLASDLIDNQGFRQALESQLGEFEKQSEKTIHQLTYELKNARQEAEDYERKLRIKDSAIADLMQELANRGSSSEFSSDIDSVLQKIDGFRADDDTSAAAGECERLARQLIGKTDGRELRFPLFKDRLTIGRTSHNDIQLNMHYVSRRHAVIATDSNKTRVIDWGSRNGVFVNGKRYSEKILKSGDTLTIGTTEFRYEEKPKR